MNNGTPPVAGQGPDPQTRDALLALCADLLPVWGRHLCASRAQSEVAVSQMLQAFADIGPHINMAERQSQQINDALAQPIGGVTGLVVACERALQPVLQDADLGAANKAAVEQVLRMVQDAVEALERVSRPFQHETHMVAQQVERMYMGFQYQDRISQMMTLLEGDMARLQDALADRRGGVPASAEWLARLETLYAMNEQRESHAGTAPVAAANAPDDNETTFF